MPIATFIPADTLRTEFSAALSEMYRTEVPLYGDLVELVAEVNKEVLGKEGSHAGEWRSADRLNVERHGAIRLGTPRELHIISRLFAIMGMYPVGYYDLSTSGVPVHATAFRPISHASLSVNPFRVFTSLLRPELISDRNLRQEVSAILGKRNIFHPLVPALIEKAENQGGLERKDATDLVKYALETFKWHEHSLVCQKTYARMRACHALLADIAGFKGPHINHLTPRVLDIDTAQRGMEARGIPPKQIIEGPPHRKCSILLRQTSFKALTENIVFSDHDGQDSSNESSFSVGSAGSSMSSGSGERGSHRARFGEIEQRGAALTRKGHDLYLSIMSQVQTVSTASNETHQAALSAVFPAFPDDWEVMRKSRLAYFRYFVPSPSSTSSSSSSPLSSSGPVQLDDLLKEGKVQYEPIVYEDFLPASAAGIFQSNLDDVESGIQSSETQGGEEEGRRQFEEALGMGRRVNEYWELYERTQYDSLKEVERALGVKVVADI